MLKPRIFVGTSGWTYEDWAGVFYPAEVKGPERLAWYARVFNTVEINATFYRYPTQTMINAWNRRLPAGFHLAVKGTRVVTHHRKLADCAGPLEEFLQRVTELRRLRVILWQLPPSLPKDIERLEGFLQLLPNTWRHAVEFRHPSWWDEEVAQLLARYRAALVAVSHPQLPDTVCPTADFLYLRFHGLGRQLYRYDYSRNELADWAEKVRPHLKGRRLYAYFNNDFDAHAPQNAKLFRELLKPPER